MKPQEIEALSFKIIDDEAGRHGFDETTWPIVRRMIHTSADFEYIQTVRFSDNAVEKGIKAIQNGCRIFTDTNMARVGIRKGDIASFGGQVVCLMTDDRVAQSAKEKGTTRALAAVDAAGEKMDGAIYVVGNAPTALLRLIELVKEGRAAPALIIGFPVGFVNAAESKAELETVTQVPYITNRGRKGGSNIAAAIVNALAIMAVAR